MAPGTTGNQTPLMCAAKGASLHALQVRLGGERGGCLYVHQMPSRAPAYMPSRGGGGLGKGRRDLHASYARSMGRMGGHSYQAFIAGLGT